MPTNPKPSRLAWRLTICVLLIGLAALTGSLVQNLQTPHPSEVSETPTRPKVPAAPWVEIHRVTNPAGQIDAVLVQPDQHQSELGLHALYLVPKGQAIPTEAPYRHLALYLERVADKSAFAATKVEDLSFKWREVDQLQLSAKQVLLYGQKFEQKISTKDSFTTVRLSYELNESRFSDVFNVKWEELYGSP